MLPFSPREAANFALSDLKTMPELRKEKKSKAASASQPDPKCAACGQVALLVSCCHCANMVCACRGADPHKRFCSEECLDVQKLLDNQEKKQVEE